MTFNTPNQEFRNLKVRIRLELIVASKELPGSELERRVGLPADRVWDVDSIAPNGGRYGNSGASYGSGLGATAPVGDHIAAFMKRLEPVRDRIGSIYADPGSIYGRLSLYCTTQELFWEHKFQPEELGFFAALGLELIVTVNRATPIVHQERAVSPRSTSNPLEKT